MTGIYFFLILRGKREEYIFRTAEVNKHVKERNCFSSPVNDICSHNCIVKEPLPYTHEVAEFQ